MSPDPNLLKESTRILCAYDELSARHSRELLAYHAENPKDTGGEPLESWVEKAALKLMFEQSDPEKFDYRFHMLRKVFLDTIETGGEANTGETFVQLCGVTGISGLLNSIWSARQLLELAYDQPADPREIPNINCDIINFLELDIVNLRLYVAAREFYGPDAFLAMMEGSLTLRQPNSLSD